jgi:hypothetical protein
LTAKKHFLSDYLLSEGTFYIGENFTTLLLCSILYIVLLTLLSFAFSTQTGPQSEYHGAFLLEDVLPGWSSGDASEASDQHSSLRTGFVLVLFHPYSQYVRSHIGEKRTDDSDSSILTGSQFGAQTALFYSAVFCLWRENNDQRRNMVMPELFPLGLLEHKLF